MDEDMQDTSATTAIVAIPSGSVPVSGSGSVPVSGSGSVPVSGSGSVPVSGSGSSAMYDEYELQLIAEDLNVEALFVALSQGTVLYPGAKESVAALEIQYRTHPSGEGSVTGDLVRSMCVMHGCEPQHLAWVVPDYARCLREIVERNASCRFQQTLENRKLAAFHKNDQTAATFKKGLERQMQQLKAEAYLDLAGKLEETAEDMISQLELFDVE